jgi:hypothetical protein
MCFLNRYYECTIDDVLDDGTCTIVFDGFESAPLTVVRVSEFCYSKFKINIYIMKNIFYLCFSRYQN